ncbi:RNA polymerase sigma factor [Pedobacter sp. MR2016-24]|uniref:RNA polymerase sigma factor n=1 Tax=Pedobacter sp. MR2016-24 TaxID=2994466 RepID=UPI0022456A4C|nr:sigma-70 family RNA polymerase sigma factor [Pedobacter sp. MR2016-24]MCX2485784.1 sigma-70 family RNA polymerase sigma factor [Pedobacter sp. MR2016-24]
MHEYSRLTDFELADMLKKGEEKAFREIYNRYWDRAYIKSYKRINDALEAEEIVQDIFCNLWRKRDTFSLVKGFDNYFAGAVKFEVINRFAKQARQAKLKNQAMSSFSEIDNSTINDIDLKEFQHQLQQSILELPDKCGQVFRLKFEKDYTQQQIAEELQISEKTVEAHLSKARKLLKSKFGRLLNLLICFL